MVPGLATGPGMRCFGSMLEVPMQDQTFASTTVAVCVPLFSPEEELALAGFLAGYSGLTREAYGLDLRQYVTWCTEHRVVLFGARRHDIESFGRHLETLGRARATIARRLCTVAAFYRYAEEDTRPTSSRRSSLAPPIAQLPPARDRKNAPERAICTGGESRFLEHQRA